MTLAVGYHVVEGKHPDRSYPATTCLDIDAAGEACAQQSPLALCRIYFKGAPEHVEIASRARLAPFTNVVVGNEPNLPIEEFPGGPDRFADYWTRVCMALPDKSVWFPSPSPGISGWQDWITHPDCRTAIQRSAGIAVHAYGELEDIKGTIWWYSTCFPTTPLYLAEFNFGAGRQRDLNDWAGGTIQPLLGWINKAIPKCVAATYFAWEWSPDSPTPVSVNAHGSAVVTEIDQWIAANPYTPPPEVKPVLKGIDVSNHQAVISWSQVAASGVQFAFMKATEDPAYYDKWFKINWERAKNNGLVRGAYHYANPDEGPPGASVKLFKAALDEVGGLQPGDMIALDIESGTGDLYEWVKAWCEQATLAFGVKPFIYSGHWFLEPHGLERPELGQYPLWLASWQDTHPPVPTGWDKVTVWQTSASGRTPGVNGGCDLDQFDGTVDELRALGYQSPVVVPDDPITAALDGLWAATVELDAIDHHERAVKMQEYIAALKVAIGR